MSAPETVTPMRGIVYVDEVHLRHLLRLPDTVQIAFVDSSSSPAGIRVGLIGVPAEALGWLTPTEVIQSQADCADWPILRTDWPARGEA